MSKDGRQAAEACPGACFPGSPSAKKRCPEHKANVHVHAYVNASWHQTCLATNIN